MANDIRADPPQASNGVGNRRFRLLVAFWFIVVAGTAGYLLAGSMQAVSYRYNAFSQRTFRDVEYRRLVDTWSDQVDALPAVMVGRFVDEVFIAAIVITVIAFACATWLLLVSAPRSAGGPIRIRRATRA